MREPPEHPDPAGGEAALARADVTAQVALPLDGITDAVVVIDRAWRYAYVNARAGALFGREPASLVGRHVWTEFPEGVGQSFHLAYERAMATRTEVRFEDYYAPWDRWFENRIFPTADGLLILFTERTEERRGRATLERSEARFRSLSESSPVGIFELAPGARALYVNRRLTEIWGMGEAAMLDTGWTAHVHPEDLPEVLAACQSAITAGHAYEREYRLRLPGGATRRVHVRSAPLRDAAGAPVGAVGTVEDVTERSELQARLQQSQKLEAVGQLAGGIAHDFNNMLSVIQGNLELVAAELSADHPAHGDLAEIRAAAERTRALVRQLLAFSRKQVLAVARVDVNAVVRDAERLLRRVIGEEIALQVALAPGPLPVTADAGQLEQVLLNLALNARDAMLTARHGHPGTGGALTVETDAVALTPADAGEWSPLAPGPYARLTVRDTGHGMDARTVSHAFEPFFTTKPVGEGTGLGLATVYGIVTQSGGAVRLRTVPGAGTTVVVLLPHAGAAAPAAPDPTGRAAPGDARGRGTVLLAEDEGAVRVAARRLLERRGFTVLEARHGADALLVWREHRDAITAVVTDVRMPELGGPELVAALRREAPALPVVYVSGYAEQGRMAALQPHEAFVEKPFSGPTLADALERVLAAAAP